MKFFERTFLTLNLRTLSGEVLRRLNGIHTESSALYNMTTQFGGGKTHSLALLYHLATSGSGSGSSGSQHISVNADLSFSIPSLQYGPLDLWADFEYYGEVNGEMLWKLSDHGPN